MMKQSSFLSLVLFAASMACAPTAAPRVIEPTAGGGVSGSDEAFVLSRKPVQPSINVETVPVHLEGAWFPFRAKYLSITTREAVLRDRRISSTRPPREFWDEQTATEAVSVWSALCNECHGGRRKLNDALEMPSPPPTWGVGEGLFFGRKRPYIEIFGTISDGGPMLNGVESEMPDWSDRLSREQIWSLVYFLEYQSGGIEGRFPPSLYPRGPSAR